MRRGINKVTLAGNVGDDLVFVDGKPEEVKEED